MLSFGTSFLIAVGIISGCLLLALRRFRYALSQQEKELLRKAKAADTVIAMKIATLKGETGSFAGFNQPE